MTRWPRLPWFSIMAFLAGVSLTAMLLTFWIRKMPLVERYDMPAYFRTSLPEVPFWTSYTVVTHDGHLALPEETGTFRLEKKKFDPIVLHSWLHMWVYHSSVWWVLKFPLLVSWLLLLGLLLWARTLDNRYNLGTRDGHTLRGPELATAAQFNAKVKRQDRAFYIESE
jgi:hypothetical protein